MLDESVYGVANNDYLEAVRSMNAVDTVYNVTKLGAWYNAARGIQYLDVDIPLLNQYLWFFAISEPYDSVSYKTIAGMYDHYTMSHGQECLDVLLTKLYISCVLKETVDLPDLSEWIKRQKLAGKSKNIYLLASGLRWMGDRERERFVLEALQADRGTYAQLAEEHLREL